MKKISVFLEVDQYRELKDRKINISEEIRSALKIASEDRGKEEYRKDIIRFNSDAKKLLEVLYLYLESDINDDYISYLHIYAGNRGFKLPSRYFFSSDKNLLRKEKELRNAMRKDETYSYREMHGMSKKLDIELSKYFYLNREVEDKKYRIDLLIRSYDYRSLFIFLSNAEEKVKLRTFKRHFIEAFKYKKSGEYIYLTTKTNSRGKVEITSMRDR